MNGPDTAGRQGSASSTHPFAFDIFATPKAVWTPLRRHRAAR